MHNNENLKVEDPEEYMLYLYYLYAKQRSELCKDTRVTMVIVHRKIKTIQCSVWMILKEEDLVLL